MSELARENLLRVENLAYRIPGGRTLAHGLNFALAEREILWVTGSNGSGKSTLIRTLLGEHRRAEGRVEFGVAADRIEYLPQLQNLHFHVPATLRDIVRMALRKAPSDEEILHTGLLAEDQLDRPWNGASGGEKKRVLLARILLRRPKLVFLDEPMNHLDADSREKVLEALARFVGRDAASLVWVSHTDGIEKKFGDCAVKAVHLGEPTRVDESPEADAEDGA